MGQLGVQGGGFSQQGTSDPEHQEALPQRLSQGLKHKGYTGCLNDKGRNSSGDKFLLPDHRQN